MKKISEEDPFQTQFPDFTNPFDDYVHSEQQHKNSIFLQPLEIKLRINISMAGMSTGERQKAKVAKAMYRSTFMPTWTYKESRGVNDRLA